MQSYYFVLFSNIIVFLKFVRFEFVDWFIPVHDKKQLDLSMYVEL